MKDLREGNAVQRVIEYSRHEYLKIHRENEEKNNSNNPSQPPVSPDNTSKENKCSNDSKKDIILHR